jgi:hopanoid biosynthesis associated RND transporter like protein HpnN
VFPREELAVVVIDAPTAEAAGTATDALAGRLRARKALFERVEVPGDLPFFERNALLFLPPDRLEALATQLTDAEPLLSILGGDPNLRGLARLLTLAEQSAANGMVPDEFAGMLARFAATTEARAGGTPATLDWKTVLPFGAGDDRKRRIVLAKPVIDDATIERATPALNALREDMATVAAGQPGVTMRLTGDPALHQQELNDAFSGALYASGLSFVLVALSLVLGIRSGRLIGALLITLVIGTVWAMGLAAITVGQLNLISVAFTVLFFGLGVDFGTHLGLRHLEETAKGAPFGEALDRSMLGEGPGIVLSALCAAIGFLSFAPTSYTGLAEFGIISAWGMVVAVAVTVTVLPALMAIMPPRRPTGVGVSIGLGGFIKRRAGAILLVALLMTAGAAFLAPQARLDVNPLNLQNQATEPVRTFRDLAGDPETSPYALNVLSPDLPAAQALAARLRGVEGAHDARTAASFVPADQDAKRRIIEETAAQLGPALEPPNGEAALDDAALGAAFADLRRTSAALASAAPSGSDVARQAGRFAAALDAFARTRGAEPASLRELDGALASGILPLLADLKQRLQVPGPVSLSDLPPELRRDWLSPDGRARVQVLPATDISSPEALETFAGRVLAVAPEATGTPVIVTEAGNAIVQAFMQAIAYTAIAIALVIAFVRRRVSDVVLVLAPLALASLWTVAAAAVFDLPFNFANVIVIPLLIGLGVASSVHIVVRAREGGGHGAGEAGGVLDSSTPLAVLVAQLNTVAAFATLTVSEHLGLYSMGLLLGLAILFVLIASLVVLPALMVWWERRRRGPETGVARP